MAFLAWAQVGRTALAYAADLRPEVVGGVLNKLRCVCARLVALDHGVNPPHKHRRADEADRTCAMGRRREGRCEIGCYDTTTIKFMGQLTVGFGSQQKACQRSTMTTTTNTSTWGGDTYRRGSPAQDRTWPCSQNRKLFGRSPTSSSSCRSSTRSTGKRICV
jgi:hypothetical protein